MEKVRPRCSHPSDPRRLKNRRTGRQQQLPVLVSLALNLTKVFPVIFQSFFRMPVLLCNIKDEYKSSDGDYGSWTLSELRTRLRKFGAKLAGRNHKLVERLGRCFASLKTSDENLFSCRF